MNESPVPAHIDGKLFGLRVVVTGLLAGLAVVTGVMVFSTLKLVGPMAPDPVVADVFLGFAGLFLVANLVVVPVGLTRARTAIGGVLASGDPFARYAAETFVRAGLLEGASIFLVVGFMITANWLVLAPVAVFAVMLAALMPSRARFEAWAEGVRQPPS